MHTVAVIVGSLRKESFNRSLAKALARAGKDMLSFTFVEIGDLPLYNQDLDDNLPAPVVRLKEEVAAADAVLFATPEYNRSIPGVLKNALDWGSRPYGKNVWGGKPAAIVGISPGHVGTAVAQSHLRSVLAILNMPLLSQPEVYMMESGRITPEGEVTDPSTLSFLNVFLKRFAEWVAITGKKI